MSRDRQVSTVTIADYARLFGTSEQEIYLWSSGAGKIDLRFQRITGAERDALILGILNRIDSDDMQVAGDQRQPDWENGWRENLQDFIASGYDVERLVPKYFKKNVPIRFLGDYILPVDSDFVLACTRLFRDWLFRRYLEGYPTVYEFGCGPASHLAFLAQTFPGMRLYGLDWAAASQEIIALLASHHNWNIQGCNFNFFAPDLSFHLERGSAVFTFGALEQIGARHSAFMDYLLAEKPALVVNVECLAELYRPDSLVDALALKYHRRRNYLEGWLTRLRELEGERRVEIVAVHHQQFGNVYDDSHSYVIWKPTL